VGESDKLDEPDLSARRAAAQSAVATGVTWRFFPRPFIRALLGAS